MVDSKLIQMSTAYGQSLLAYGTGGAPRPFSASFAVSNRCNLRCSYCNFPLMEEPELEMPQIADLFSRLKALGVVRLGILGGEPLYRNDILEIISLAKQQGFFVSLNTNLLLYDKFKNDLNSVGHFFTSIDGTPEKHESNRGKQSYDKILRAIRDLVVRCRPVTAICVVTDPDKESADYLIDLAEREGINIHFQPECYDTEIVLRSAEIGLDQQAIRGFWKYIAKRKKEGAPIASSLAYLRYISEWDDYAKSSVLDLGTKCAAGRGFLFVDSTGYAYPCAYTKGMTKGVNMLERDWKEAFVGQTPCTKCIVGPMLEFNLLYRKPLQSAWNAMKQYG